MLQQLIIHAYDPVSMLSLAIYVVQDLACWLQKASQNRRPSPVLLPNRRRFRTPSPSLPDSMSPLPSPSFVDGLAALHKAATSPERQPRSALMEGLPVQQTGAGLPRTVQQEGAGFQSIGAGQFQDGPEGQSNMAFEHQQPALEPAYKKKKMSHLRVDLPDGVRLPPVLTKAHICTEQLHDIINYNCWQTAVATALPVSNST